MLIEENKLNIDYFKLIFDSIIWKKKIRVLSENRKEVFYIGKFENEDKVIKITIRPSMRMQVSESFKNRTLEGKVPPKDFKGQLCEFGSTIEVIVDKSVVDQISQKSKNYETEKPQVISW